MKLPAILSRLFRKAAVTPLSYGDGWLGIIREPWTGAFQQHMQIDAPRDVVAFSAVFACVTKIASDVAKMRAMLVKHNEDGTCTEWQKVSPLREVLEKPNHYQNRITFFQQWVASKLLHGNTYALKGRDDRGVVRRLYILDPQRVRPIVTDTGDVYYQIKADPLAGVGDQVVAPAKEIIHDMMPPLWHPLCGVPPIFACGLSATMGNRIQKNSTGFFGNMSRPGGVLVTPAKMSQGDMAELKGQWESNYGGENTGRTAVLANGLEFKPINPVVAEQAQLIQQLDWTIADVARCFHIPLYKIGGPIPANTSVETLNQMYYDECLQVLIEAAELSLKEGLGLESGYDVRFDLDALMRMDTAARYEAKNKAVRGGWMAPNEARKGENLPPVAGGETPYMQHQDYPIATLAKRPPPDDAKPAPALPAPAANDDNAERMAAIERALEVRAPVFDLESFAEIIERGLSERAA